MPTTQRSPRPARSVRVAGAVALVCAPAVASGLPAVAGAAVVPRVDCVLHDPVTGLGGARFGYVNDGSSSVTIPPGSSGNFLSPPPVLRGQPTTFRPGDHPAALTVLWDAAQFPTMTWILDGATAGATPAGTTAPPCSDVQPVAPVTSATGATGVTRTAATLPGAVAPGGRDTVARVEWGTDPAALDRSGPEVPVAAGLPLAPLSLSVDGLSPATRYAYRVVARNAQGETASGVASFTTAPGPAAPVALTMPAEGTTATAATVTGVVDPAGEDAVWWFEHGTGDAPARATPEVAATGSGARPVAATVEGLTPGAVLRYRLVVRSAGGLSRGAERTATLPGLPAPTVSVLTPPPAPGPPKAEAARDPALRVTVPARVRGTVARVRVRIAAGARGRVSIVATRGGRRAAVAGPRTAGAVRTYALRRLRPGRWVVRVRFSGERGWATRTVSRTVRVTAPR